MILRAAILLGNIIMIVVVIASLLPAQQEEKPYVVEWLGWPVVARKYSGPDVGIWGDHPPPDFFLGDSVEIGLRSDGVVVWRNLRADSARGPR